MGRAPHPARGVCLLLAAVIAGTGLQALRHLLLNIGRPAPERQAMLCKSLMCHPGMTKHFMQSVEQVLGALQVQDVLSRNGDDNVTVIVVQLARLPDLPAPPAPVCD